MEATIIIPARGGSRGIREKNLQVIGGWSLIGRAVRTAVAADVGPVIVSTDHCAIAEDATDCGAHAYWRSRDTATDTASSESALLDVLRNCLIRTENIVMLQCTSPFTSVGDVRGCLACLEDADSAFTACKTHAFLWRYLDGCAVGVNHDSSRRMLRQELDQEYMEAGSVYAMRKDGFLEARHRFFGRVAIYEVSALRAMQIDSHEDLELVRAVYRSGYAEISV